MACESALQQPKIGLTWVIFQCLTLRLRLCPSNHFWREIPGLGSILDTVSEDTEDTANLYLFNASLPHSHVILLLVTVSKYLEDTEDTAPHASLS